MYKYEDTANMVMGDDYDDDNDDPDDDDDEHHVIPSPVVRSWALKAARVIT